MGKDRKELDYIKSKLFPVGAIFFSLPDKSQRIVNSWQQLKATVSYDFDLQFPMTEVWFLRSDEAQ